MKSRDRYEQVLRMQRSIVGECEHRVEVRKINNAWHCRVFLNDVLNQEARCFTPSDIGFMCRSMLRWEDKCGNISRYAGAARERHNRKDFSKEYSYVER